MANKTTTKKATTKTTATTKKEDITMTTVITKKETAKGFNLMVNGRKVAAIVAKEKGRKVIVYVNKTLGTDLSVYQKAFDAKNTKKTIRANSVEVCSTYLKTEGKDPCFAILKFAPDIDLNAVQEKLADIAVKSSERFAPKPEVTETVTEEAPVEEPVEA